MTEGKVWEASAVPAPATTQLHLSPSGFCLRLEKDTRYVFIAYFDLSCSSFFDFTLLTFAAP